MPARFAPILFGFVLSGLMSFIVSGISTFRNAGPIDGFFNHGSELAPVVAHRLPDCPGCRTAGAPGRQWPGQALTSAAAEAEHTPSVFWPLAGLSLFHVAVLAR
jgi:hypothetical protein